LNVKTKTKSQVNRLKQLKESDTLKFKTTRQKDPLTDLGKIKNNNNRLSPTQRNRKLLYTI